MAANADPPASHADQSIPPATLPLQQQLEQVVAGRVNMAPGPLALYRKNLPLDSSLLHLPKTGTESNVARLFLVPPSDNTCHCYPIEHC
eukprot:613143-Amphidinium_carterae.1